MIGTTYSPIHDPAAMFVVAGMSGLLALFAALVTGPWLAAWFKSLRGLGIRVSPERRATRMAGGRALPVPFAVASAGAVLLSRVSLLSGLHPPPPSPRGGIFLDFSPLIDGGLPPQPPSCFPPPHWV